MNQRHGRDALFGPPNTAPPRRVAEAEGRRALFSAPPRRKGTVIVECDRCEARTPIPLVELAPRLLPSFGLPGRTFSRFMRCPACRQPAWCQVHWRSLLD